MQDTTLKECKNKIVDLTARSMSNNVTISGLTGDNAEEKECEKKVLNFLRNEVSMEVEDSEIIVAHRIGGPPKGEKPRLMVVRCKPSLRNRIFKYTRNLKDKNK